MDQGSGRKPLSSIFWIGLGILCGLLALRLWGPTWGRLKSARVPAGKPMATAAPADFQGLPYADLPGVDLAGLSRSQRFTILHRAAAEPCTCGCKETIAECRHSDMNCDTSLVLARKIRAKVASATPLNPAH